MDKIVAKVIEVLKAEQIFQSLPKYFEEPSLPSIRGYNKYEVVLSCLSLTVKQRKYLTKKILTEDKEWFSEAGVQNNISSSVETVGLLFSEKSITNSQSCWVVEEIMKMTVQSNTLIKKAKEGQKRQDLLKELLQQSQQSKYPSLEESSFENDFESGGVSLESHTSLNEKLEKMKEIHDETIQLCKYIQTKFQELDRQQRQLQNERHEFQVKVQKQKEELDRQNMTLHSFKAKSKELEQKERDLENERLIFEEEIKKKKQELDERANKMNADRERLNQEYFEIISLLGEDMFTQESVSALLSDEQSLIGKALIKMTERVKGLMKMIREGQEREGLLKIQLSEAQDQETMQKKMHRSALLETESLKERLKAQSEDIKEREKNLAIEKEVLENQTKSDMAALERKQRELEDKETMFEKKRKQEVEKLHDQEKKHDAEYEAKREDLNKKEKELEMRRIQFEEQMEIEIKEFDEQSRRAYNDLQSLAEDLKLKKQELEDERQEFKDKIERQNRDLQNQQEDFERQKKLLDTEKQKFSALAKRREKEMMTTKRSIENEKKELINKVSVKCMNDCDNTILFYDEAINIIKEELGPECCNHVITFPHSGFHLLHDFMELNGRQWRRQSIMNSKLKHCNLIKIGQPGIPASVILHAPWPKTNQIECWVRCTDDDTYCDVGKKIASSIDAVLDRKCSIQYYCELEGCKESRHLSSPNPKCPQYFVCDNTSIEFCPHSSKNRLLTEEIPWRIFTTQTAGMVARKTRHAIGSEIHFMENCEFFVEGRCVYISETSQQCKDQAMLLQIKEKLPQIKEQLTVKALMEDVAPFALNEWRMVGLSLSFSNSQLSAINNDNLHQSRDCYLGIFSAWEENGNPPFKWETILQILCKPHIAKYKLVDRLIKKLTRQ